MGARARVYPDGEDAARGVGAERGTSVIVTGRSPVTINVATCFTGSAAFGSGGFLARCVEGKTMSEETVERTVVVEGGVEVTDPEATATDMAVELRWAVSEASPLVRSSEPPRDL
jgi:hypothetical protein